MIISKMCFFLLYRENIQTGYGREEYANEYGKRCCYVYHYHIERIVVLGW